MRWSLVAVVASLAGCFSELPAPPSGASEGSSTTGGTGTTTSTSGTSGTTEEPTSAPDQDHSSGEAPGPPPQGLFACKGALGCGPWDCGEGCDGGEPEATCVLTSLRDRVKAPLEIRTCQNGACEVRRIVPRGGGTEDSMHQTRSEAEPPAYSETSHCSLKAAEFFSACLKNFDPMCADPNQWVDKGCEVGVPEC